MLHRSVAADMRYKAAKEFVEGEEQTVDEPKQTDESSSSEEVHLRKDGEPDQVSRLHHEHSGGSRH